MTIDIIKSAIYSTIKYEAVSLPPKFAVLNFTEKNWPTTQREQFSDQELREHKKDMGILFLVACVAGPIIEELVFRGAILGGVEWITGSETVGEIASTILFSLLHYKNRNNPVDVIFMLSDCHFVYNPLKASGGLIATIAAHSFHNFIQVVPFLKRSFFS